MVKVMVSFSVIIRQFAVGKVASLFVAFIRWHHRWLRYWYYDVVLYCTVHE